MDEQENLDQQQSNQAQTRRPDFTGAGFAIWKNLDKNGKEYLWVNDERTGAKFVCFSNKPKES